MHRSSSRICFCFSALCVVAEQAVALTPAEVFSIASPSIVVVRALDKKLRDIASGSGVVIRSGLIATNCHVLNAGTHYLAGRIGRFNPATLVDADIDRDLCLLSASGIDSAAVMMGSATGLRVGAPVYAIGAPQGLELSLSDGLVSQLRGESQEPLIQTTAPISPGSSGGGLFDSSARLVGITTFFAKDGQNLNFAIPVEALQRLIEKTLHPNHVSREMPVAVPENGSVNKGRETNSASGFQREEDNWITYGRKEASLVGPMWHMVARAPHKRLYTRSSSIYMEPNSGSATATFWIEYDREQSEGNYTYRAQISLVEIKCRSRELALVSMTQYANPSANGPAVSSYYPSEKKFSPIAPGSLEEIEFNHLCTKQ